MDAVGRVTTRTGDGVRCVRAEMCAAHIRMCSALPGARSAAHRMGRGLRGPEHQEVCSTLIGFASLCPQSAVPPVTIPATLASASCTSDPTVPAVGSAIAIRYFAKFRNGFAEVLRKFRQFRQFLARFAESSRDSHIHSSTFCRRPNNVGIPRDWGGRKCVIFVGWGRGSGDIMLCYVT